MDFMKLLKSIDELLYELISWFIFYPLTFWRIVRHPIGMLAYAQSELTAKDENQFDDAVSPPILLLLTLVILHLSESAMDAAWAAALPELLRDDRNLLMFRALLFSLFPLLFATASIGTRGARLTRTTLKPAFYSQSYATVPFVLALSIGLQMIGRHSHGAAFGIVGAAVLALGLIWYVSVQTIWFSRDGRRSRSRSLVLVLGVFSCAVLLVSAAAALVSLVAPAAPA